MRYTNQTFTKRNVELDNNEFENCKFDDVDLIYRAIGPTSMVGCSFGSFRMTFDGSASNTVAFLAGLYAHGGAFRDLVEQTLDNIRGGRLNAPPSNSVN